EPLPRDAAVLLDAPPHVPAPHSRKGLCESNGEIGAGSSQRIGDGLAILLGHNRTDKSDVQHRETSMIGCEKSKTTSTPGWVEIQASGGVVEGWWFTHTQKPHNFIFCKIKIYSTLLDHCAENPHTLCESVL